MNGEGLGKGTTGYVLVDKESNFVEMVVRGSDMKKKRIQDRFWKGSEVIETVFYIYDQIRATARVPYSLFDVTF